MYINYTKSKTLLTAAAVSIAMAFSGVAMAGPGKPGKNNDPDALNDLNIVEIATLVNNGGEGEFNNLLAAVGCFDDVPGGNPFIAALSGTDKYTLFAPVDAAFDDLLCRLGVSDPCLLPSETLATVLSYHVVESRRFSNSLFNRNNSKIIETLAGVDIISYFDGLIPTLHDVDGQMISPVEGLFNINATNGVVHVVDGVLLPIALPPAPETCDVD
jgi:uncharacterized surface protein with fasciclin (FAS1) repeats